MKIEFNIKLAQSHPKPTTFLFPYGRGWGVRKFFATKRDSWGKKELVNFMQSIRCGHELIKNKNIEDKKIKHIWVKNLL